MSRTVILSEATLAALLEAHASMAAWYYELGAALAEGRAAVTPDDAARKRFLERLATDFPEVANTAQGIQSPRLYVPPPPLVAPPAIVAPATESEQEA